MHAPRRRSPPTSAPMSSCIGGGYTGMWAAWHLKALEPEARVVLLEASTCGHGPSGRNGGFCNVMWFSLQNMRERWGDAAALAVAEASREAVAGSRGVLRGAGRRRLVPPRRLPPGLDRARPGRDLERDRRAPAARSGSRTCVEPLDPERGRRRTAARPPSAAAPSTPTRRPCSRRGSRSASATACSPPASRSTRARRCGVCARRPTASRRGPTAARSGPAPRWSRSARAAAGRRGPLRKPAHRHLLSHRPHRAGARAARGDRLDRRRVHHRLPDDAPLLPHDPGRPDRLRPRRRPDLLQRRPPRPGRGRPPRSSTSRRSGCAPTSRGSRGARSPTPGAARSTSPRPTCRW